MGILLKSVTYNLVNARIDIAGDKLYYAYVIWNADYTGHELWTGSSNLDGTGYTDVQRLVANRIYKMSMKVYQGKQYILYNKNYGSLCLGIVDLATGTFTEYTLDNTNVDPGPLVIINDTIYFLGETGNTLYFCHCSLAGAGFTKVNLGITANFSDYILIYDDIHGFFRLIYNYLDSNLYVYQFERGQINLDGTGFTHSPLVNNSFDKGVLAHSYKDGIDYIIYTQKDANSYDQFYLIKHDFNTDSLTNIQLTTNNQKDITSMAVIALDKIYVYTWNMSSIIYYEYDYQGTLLDSPLYQSTEDGGGPLDLIADAAGNRFLIYGQWNIYLQIKGPMMVFHVVATDPANLATGIPPDKIIKITFDDIPVIPSIWVEIYDQLSNLIYADTYADNTDPYSILVDPYYPNRLPTGQITVKVNAGSSQSGKKLESYTFVFTVAPPSFHVIATNPVDKAIDVLPDAQIRIDFDADLNPATLSGITISGIGTFNIEVQGKSLYITPLNLWKSMVTYQVSLPDTVKSLNNASLVPYSFSFTVIKYIYRCDGLFYPNKNPIVNPSCDGRMY